MIHVGFISTTGRLRDVDREQVARLAESIKEVGLLNPITLYRREIIRNGQHVDGYGLIAGAHRLEAVKSLGWQEVPAVIVDLDDDDRIIAECDENLCGPKLSAAEHAQFTATRKSAYLRKHPETGHGGDRKSDQVDKLSSCSSFDRDQAAKTGVDPRTVRRNAERGEKIDPAALALIKGTKLDTGAYLDKIKKVDQEKQVAKVQRDLAEAAKPKPKPKPAPEPEPQEDPYGYAKLTGEALLDLANGLRADLEDEKAKRKQAEAKTKDLSEKLKRREADDKDAVIVQMERENKRVRDQAFKAGEDARINIAKARREKDRADKLERRLKELERDGVVIL